MSNEPTIHLTEAQLAEIDRAARAYGFEVGRGHPVTKTIDGLSADNPFLDTNWASDLLQTDELEEPKENKLRKNIFDNSILEA